MLYLCMLAHMSQLNYYSILLVAERSLIFEDCGKREARVDRVVSVEIRDVCVDKDIMGSVAVLIEEAACVPLDSVIRLFTTPGVITL